MAEFNTDLFYKIGSGILIFFGVMGIILAFVVNTKQSCGINIAMSSLGWIFLAFGTVLMLFSFKLLKTSLKEDIIKDDKRHTSSMSSI